MVVRFSRGVPWDIYVKASCGGSGSQSNRGSASVRIGVARQHDRDHGRVPRLVVPAPVLGSHHRGRGRAQRAPVRRARARRSLGARALGLGVRGRRAAPALFRRRLRGAHRRPRRAAAAAPRAPVAARSAHAVSSPAVRGDALGCVPPRSSRCGAPAVDPSDRLPSGPGPVERAPRPRSRSRRCATSAGRATFRRCWRAGATCCARRTRRRRARGRSPRFFGTYWRSTAASTSRSSRVSRRVCSQARESRVMTTARQLMDIGEAKGRPRARPRDASKAGARPCTTSSA